MTTYQKLLDALNNLNDTYPELKINLRTNRLSEFEIEVFDFPCPIPPINKIRGVTIIYRRSIDEKNVKNTAADIIKSLNTKRTPVSTQSSPKQIMYKHDFDEDDDYSI